MIRATNLLVIGSRRLAERRSCRIKQSSDRQARMMTHHFDPMILREYDVRGVFGQTLGADDARDRAQLCRAGDPGRRTLRGGRARRAGVLADP
jgi:hypothetical protein